MAPLIASTLRTLKRSFDGVPTLKESWVSPSVLTVVMIIGGDVVQVALAQLVGQFYTPVPFSFGWVAYSFTSLILAVGENKLMPDSDCPCIVINTKSQQSRDNRSWILGRLIRDYEYWQPRKVKEETERILDEATEKDREKAKKKAEREGVPYNQPPRRVRAGLCVAFYKAPGEKAGKPMKDWVYWTGVVVTIIQFGIAIIPWILFGDWLIFLITASGTILAILAAALPQWKAEKWECRRQRKTIALTRGNGEQHVLVIEGVDETSLDMEDLAAGAPRPHTATRYYIGTLSVFWIGFLITVSGITEDPWFLMAVGGLGMLQNVFVAGVPRRPGGFGIYLELSEVIARPTVMETLKDIEGKYPGVGASLVGTFFPGKLHADDVTWWAEAERRAEESKAARKNIGSTSSFDVLNVRICLLTFA
jgi:hypothetical protein